MSFVLGQYVTVTDYLVRCKMSIRDRRVAAQFWPSMPSELRPSLNAPVGGWFDYPNYAVWVPSLVIRRCAEINVLLQTDHRYHPYSTPSKIPTDGVVFRRSKIQSGRVDRDIDVGTTFVMKHSEWAYHVAYDLSRRPLLCTPAMLDVKVTV